MTTEFSSFDLSGRIAIITGASRGIGNAIALGLASTGATVFGIGRSPSAECNVGAFSYQSCDINKKGAFGKFVNEVFDKEGRIDILVNAAGITLPGKAKTDPSLTFRQTLDTNLTAVFDCCLAVIPCMNKGGYGSIINITSIGASLGFPGNPGYVASKGGLAALTRGLALDLGAQGIRVNNVVPGYVRTSMTETSYSDSKLYEARAKRTMLGRWGEPEELQGAVIFLASSASSYVTGIDLYVDGGWAARGL